MIHKNHSVVDSLRKSTDTKDLCVLDQSEIRTVRQSWLLLKFDLNRIHVLVNFTQSGLMFANFNPRLAIC